MAKESFKAKICDVDMTEVTKLALELRNFRGRLAREMTTATKLSAQKVTSSARSRIRSQTTGKRTKGYPESITWEFKSKSAAYMWAVVGPQVNPRNPKQAVQLEYGNSTQAPKPHLNPALFAQHDAYATAMGQAATKAVFG